MLAQGDGWVVVSKPAALLTHRTALAPGERDAALQRVRDQLGTHVYPIHRLDRAASGCLLFATDRTLVPALQQALQQPTTRKIYLALVRGFVPAGERAWIDRPLDDKPAQTHALSLGGDPDLRCTLLACRIFTGRYHQIRRHLARRSHPILMDSSHGDTRVNRTWRERGLARLCLHAWRLELALDDRTTIQATSPIPEDLHTTLQDLPFWPEAERSLADLPPLPRIQAPSAENG